MFSHVTLGTNDFPKARAFYDTILPPLGWSCIDASAEHGYAGYARAEGTTPQFWLLKPIDGKAATVGNGVTIAFEAKNRAAVDAFHAAALAAGARDEGAPGLRPHYHADYYGAYVRDLDGNKLCCVCHKPPA
ncbi:VOC family protein [Chelatococcus sp. SYSU_G07232]|uniref:VOC family protein n=1 Tax=Chelatococcus albus TaxID=3047466 RepID=A0ABT7AKG5_9HYPH|nr:VOC family protein [Chelatococcus sp. SYSU_G07232]MDJ1159854.1 VOC family protein [Chelatococcus sp. SYSU_G07232]